MPLTTTPSHPFLTTDEPRIALFPVSPELTVMQAAKLLNVSEVYLNELLDIGAIEFRQDYGRRLIKHEDLIQYEQECLRMHEGLLEIVRLDQEMGLYDD